MKNEESKNRVPSSESHSAGGGGAYKNEGGVTAMAAHGFVCTCRIRGRNPHYLGDRVLFTHAPAHRVRASPGTRTAPCQGPGWGWAAAPVLRADAEHG